MYTHNSQSVRMPETCCNSPLKAIAGAKKPAPDSKEFQITASCPRPQKIYLRRLNHDRSIYLKNLTTDDGRNPAPVDMVNIPLFVGFYTSQVAQDFFHQQYETQKIELVFAWIRCLETVPKIVPTNGDEKW